MPLFIGTSGWNYPHWKEKFYPSNIKKKDWFSYYCENLNTVEVNYTFYNWPTEEIIKKWYEDAPKGFTYTLKAPRLITHMKKLKNAEESLQRFYHLTEGLGKKMGCHLFQLPPNYTYTDKNIEKLKNFVQLLDNKKHNAIEFREPAWFNNEILSLLKKHNVAFVTVFGIDLPQDFMQTGKTAYLRFHGHDTKYSKQKLRSVAKNINNSSAKNVYIYFNNDAYGYAPRNALELKEMV